MRLDAYAKKLAQLRYEPDLDNLGKTAPTGLKATVPAALRESMQLLLTDSVRPWAARRARRIPSPLRLHLGSGGTHLNGWVNIDLIGLPVDLPWNLRHPLPFSDGSAEAVFHEHLLEHVPLLAVPTFLQECRRVLQPGGIIRVGVPDAGRYIEDIARPAGVIESLRPGRPTPLMALAEVAYCYGHRWLWDGPTLCAALEEAGFTTVSTRAFGQSAIEPAPDSASRAPETVYVEGIHPA
jgi:SAM-dependent methyltransferase